jgi:1,4-dihydroxy-2-naphthoyl-CoA hydrolase
MPGAVQDDELVQMMPFAAQLGLRLDAVAADEVSGRIDWAPELCTAGGVLHGGALMAFADSLGGVCAYVNLPAGTSTATVSSHTNMMRAVRAGEVRGRARPLHLGRSTLVVQSELRDADGQLVAHVTQVQAVLTA